LKDWERIVKNILFAALISTIIFLAEKLLIQLISISYHRKQFDYKIKQSKRNIYLVSLLYDASRALFPAYCSEFVELDYLINDSLDIGGSRDGKKHNRSGSITPMRFIQNVGRIGDKVTAAFGNVAHESLASRFSTLRLLIPSWLKHWSGRDPQKPWLDDCGCLL